MNNKTILGSTIVFIITVIIFILVSVNLIFVIVYEQIRISDSDNTLEISQMRF